jgi:plasmid stabilization system protein ParE
MAEQLVRQPEARWIVVGPESLPEAVVHYLRAAPDTASAEELHAAVAALCESCVLPRESGTPRADLARPFRLLLTRRKLLVWQHVEPLSLGEFVASIRDVVLRGSMGNIGPALYEFHGQLVAEYNGQPLDDDTYASASDDIDAFIGAGEDSSGNKMNGTALKNLEGLRRRLRCKVDEVNACDILPEHARITMPDLVDHLNDPSTMGLFVIQSHDLDALRNFATTLGDAVYRARRRNGMSRPIVSFVFDEADKVMPSFLPGAAGDLIKMVTTLARNGVRLGLGIGIAMRDLASVHDAVVGFPRTWFIGRIARTGGRETIAAAIDVPDVSLLPAHYAREGEWLAVSDEAMGLTGVPIPFCLDAAAERARPFDKASDR